MLARLTRLRPRPPLARGMASKKPSSSSSVSYHHASGGVDEILRPTLVTTDGRSYRKLTDVQFGRRAGDREERREPRGVPQQEIYVDDVYDEGQDVVAELEGLEQLPNGTYELKLPIPSQFFKYIIGKEGRTRKDIERNTECHLRIPSRGVEGDIVIRGLSPSSIAEAKRRVEIIVWTNRTKERPTHFISIPLIQPHIKERVAEFKRAVVESCGRDRGVVPEAFQTPEKFHITLGVLRLFSQEEEEKAKAVVREAVAAAVPLLGKEPTVICVEGVQCMKDDPSSVDVLYAKVFLADNSDRLQKFVDAIAAYVIEKAPDLMNKEFEREGVKLHATLMNSKFPAKAAEDAAEKRGIGGDWRRKQAEPDWRKKGVREAFDARNIFKNFDEFHFGQLTLEVVHLSKRKEYGPDGFYVCTQQYQLKDFAPSS